MRTGIEQLKQEKLFHQYSFLVSGIGIAHSAFSVTKELLINHYDFLIQLGIAGSYSSKIAVGDMVWITQDCFADLGADTQNGFLTLKELNLAKESPKVKFNPDLCKNIPLPNNLKKVKAVTSDIIHNSPDRIAEITEIFQPDVESMEGASIMYACNQLKVPNIQVRAISNRVAPRDENLWNIEMALAQLDHWFYRYFENLESSAL